MRSELKQIPLDRIHLSDERYRISTTDTTDDLVKSIGQVGMINPPIVARADTRFIVVSGYRRLKTCFFLGWRQADIRILDQDTSPLRCLQISIAENAGTRVLNILEQAIAVQKLSVHYPDDRELCQALEPLGLALNPVLVGKFRRLRMLPATVQSCVSSDILSLTQALDLETVGEAAAEGVAKLFTLLRPTSSQQKEIFANLKDLSRFEDIPVEDLLKSSFISDLVHHKDMDRKQVIHLLRERLEKRRYPVLSAAREAFVHRVQELNLPEDEQLIPPKDFEDTRYRFVLSFETSADLARHAKRLAAVSDHPLLKKILKRSVVDS